MTLSSQKYIYYDIAFCLTLNITKLQYWVQKLGGKLPYSKGKTLFPYPYRDLCNYHINKGGLQLLKNLLNDLLYYKIVGEDWEKNGRKLESDPCKSQ